MAPSRLDQYLNGFGFLHTTGVDLPGEAAGLSDNSGDAALAAAENAFGESIGVTPLQMVAAYGALANGGVLMRPYIVSSLTADGGAGATTTYGPHQVRRVVSAQTAATVTAMLVNSARVSEAEMNLLPGYTIAAKTGTSTPDPQNASVTYASVLGYAPATNPRFVLLVKLDHPKTDIFGGSAAGPLWRALASQALHLLPDSPPTPRRPGRPRSVSRRSRPPAPLPSHPTAPFAAALTARLSPRAPGRLALLSRQGRPCGRGG